MGGGYAGFEAMQELEAMHGLGYAGLRRRRAGGHAGSVQFMHRGASHVGLGGHAQGLEAMQAVCTWVAGWLGWDGRDDTQSMAGGFRHWCPSAVQRACPLLTALSQSMAGS